LLLLSALARSENAARRKGVVTSVGMSPPLLQVARVISNECKKSLHA
jgi:hypothetical protein